MYTTRPPPHPALTGKLAGLDKKLSRSLEEEVAASSSPLELSKSPVGPLHEGSSRRTLVYLILTLNHIYPDYDFSLLRVGGCRRAGGRVRAGWCGRGARRPAPACQGLLLLPWAAQRLPPRPPCGPWPLPTGERAVRFGPVAPSARAGRAAGRGR